MKLLEKNSPQGNSQEFSAVTVTKPLFNCVQAISNVMLSKRMVILRERGFNRASVIVLESSPFLRLENAFRNPVFEAPSAIGPRLQPYCD